MTLLNIPPLVADKISPNAKEVLQKVRARSATPRWDAEVDADYVRR